MRHITKYDLDGWLARVSRADGSRFALELQNDFVTFAESPGANVEALATYQTDPVQANGFVAGLAKSAIANRALRQANHVTSSIGTFMYNNGQNALDDGNVPEFVTNYEAAIIAFLQGSASGFRIAVNTTYAIYVNASTGSDSNNGLTSGTAFLTLQRTWNYISTNLDIRTNGAIITINCTGAFTAPLLMQGVVLGTWGPAAIVWNFTAGSTLSVTNATAITATTGCQCTIGGSVTITATGTSAGQGTAISCQGSNSLVLIGNGGTINFGVCGNFHMTPENGGQIGVASNYTISGGAVYHQYITGQGRLIANNSTVTLTGTPAFTAFAELSEAGYASLSGNTYSGSATGVHANVIQNSILDTSGAGASYLPGNASATTASGGQIT